MLAWRPDARTEGIAEYALQLMSESVVSQFYRRAQHVRNGLTLEERSGTVHQLENFGIHLIRTGAERMVDRLRTLVCEHHGSYPSGATGWILRATKERIDYVATAVQDHLRRLDDDLGTWDRNVDRVRRAADMAIQQCALQLMSVTPLARVPRDAPDAELATAGIGGICGD